MGLLCLARVVENLAGPCPGWALLRLRSLPPVEEISVPSAPSFESFFPTGFVTVEKFPFGICTVFQGVLRNENGLFFFFC